MFKAFRQQQAAYPLVILLVAAGAASGQVIGYWEFDERSPGNYVSSAAGAIVDSSGSNHHLTAAGTEELPFYVDGSFAFDSGSALNFLDPEDDKLFYPDSGGSDFDFAAGESFTIEAVIGGFSQPDIGAIVAKDGMLASDPQWWLRHEDGQLKLLIGDGTNVASVSTGINPLAAVNDGAWHHIAAVRDANEHMLRIYVDYVLYAQAPDTTTAALANDVDMTIGAFANTISREFGPGNMDFVKITKSALAPSQFEQMLPENEGVLALWNFEEGEIGTQATGAAGEILDASGNGRNATALGEEGAYPTYVDGRCGTKALQFTAGIDAVIYPYSAPYPFDIAENEGMTFELVLRSSVSGIYQGLVSRDDAASQYWTRIRNTGVIQFFVSEGSGSSLNADTVTINDGEWHHVAFVRDGRLGQLKLYVDNELVARASEPTAGEVANTQPLTIAEFVTSTSRSFVGEIDLVRVSSGALEPEDFINPCPDLRADFDGDGDVDLDDFAIFQAAFTGPR